MSAAFRVLILVPYNESTTMLTNAVIPKVHETSFSLPHNTVVRNMIRTKGGDINDMSTENREKLLCKGIKKAKGALLVIHQNRYNAQTFDKVT